jgi:hypothetical protein
MSEKAVNYTDEMTARLHAVYDAEDSEEAREVQIAQLADELDRSVPSIRAKLTREGVYVPKAKAPAGKNTVRKAQIVAAIAEKLGVDEDIVGSLEKATKNTLVRVFNAL